MKHPNVPNFGYVPRGAKNGKVPKRPELATNLPELEERVCEGGCGIKFKVMASSPMRRAKADCATRCKRDKPADPFKFVCAGCGGSSYRERGIFDVVCQGCGQKSISPGFGVAKAVL